MGMHSDMLRLLESRKPGFSLQQPFYTDPDFFKLDMELIWSREWLFVNRCGMLTPYRRPIFTPL